MKTIITSQIILSKKNNSFTNYENISTRFFVKGNISTCENPS